MAVDTANAHELDEIAGEIGAAVLEGALRNPSETGGWQLGDLDLSEYLDRYRDQRLVLVIASMGEAEPATCTCGVCGFVYSECGEPPRCRVAIQEGAAGPDSGGDTPDILDQVDRLLTELDGDQPSGESI